MPANPSWYGTPVGFVTPATPHTRISSAVTPGTLPFCAPAGAATPIMDTASAATIRQTATRTFPRPLRIGDFPPDPTAFVGTLAKPDARVRSAGRFRSRAGGRQGRVREGGRVRVHGEADERLGGGGVELGDELPVLDLHVAVAALVTGRRVPVRGLPVDLRAEAVGGPVRHVVDLLDHGLTGEVLPRGLDPGHEQRAVLPAGERLLRRRLPGLLHRA